MSWRSILISKGGKLSLQQQQMQIQQEENAFSIPLEDIAIIVVESRETVITVPLLSALAQNGITLLTCDEQFLPCGQWLPFQQYHRQLKTLKLQLNASEPLKKQLWQKIVQQKIRHQAFVLNQIGESQAAEKLQKMAKRVKSGDKENLEAQSAVIYFPLLFGKGFKRNDDDNDINAYLNYAYTVLRSAVARSVVQYGWQPALGLNHCNELNAFNLADDFIEPFRPLVDLAVWQLKEKSDFKGGLTPQHKQTLIKLLHIQMAFCGQTFSVLAAIDRCVGSLQNALITKNPDQLKLPEMLPLAEHQYE